MSPPLREWLSGTRTRINCRQEADDGGCRLLRHRPWAGTESSAVMLGWVDGAIRSEERGAAEVMAEKV
ncbi:hypothetical protein BKG68_19475 [Mycobacteroides saopaulense]|uniref:Uncharacterized protein n=1 Tax=Mycobacteroides saopaulense TaxID=1578165 RepID=A0ABX3C1E7_9MYCO|nr:hypothetical protein BKG68_19475 [Mycobacteroides saopaulense]OHU10272.1 hypothetical protein BKG73_10280 [Mycobacteroides saopaulense]